MYTFLVISVKSNPLCKICPLKYVSMLRVSQIGSLLLTYSCRLVPKYNLMIQSELKENATRYQLQRRRLFLGDLLI